MQRFVDMKKEGIFIERRANAAEYKVHLKTTSCVAFYCQLYAISQFKNKLPAFLFSCLSIFPFFNLFSVAF